MRRGWRMSMLSGRVGLEGGVFGGGGTEGRRGS